MSNQFPLERYLAVRAPRWRIQGSEKGWGTEREGGSEWEPGGEPQEYSRPIGTRGAGGGNRWCRRVGAKWGLGALSKV